MSSILVTGGCGNIGSYIVEELLLSGINGKDIVVVDNLSNSNGKKFINENVTYHYIDISDYQSMRWVFQNNNIAQVYHQASMLIQDSETLPNKAIQSNILGPWNIIQLCNEFNVKKVVFASSASVHGEPIYLPVNEKHPISTKDNFLYAITKICMETLFSWKKVKFDWIGLRYYNVYSDRMNKGAFYTQVIKQFIVDIKNKGFVTIGGDGTQTMDFTHAKDIARANMLAMNSSISNEYFNTGTNIETSVNDLAYMLFDIIGIDPVMKYNSIDVQKIKRRWGDVTKIKQELGWEFQIKLRDGLKMIIDSLEN